MVLEGAILVKERKNLKTSQQKRITGKEEDLLSHVFLLEGAVARR